MVSPTQLCWILLIFFRGWGWGMGASLQKLLNKLSRCRWLETPWRWCGVTLMALMKYLDLAFILVMLLVASTLLRDYKGNSIDTRSLRHVRCRPFHGLLAQPQRQALACRWGFRVSHNQGYHLVCTWGDKWKFIYGPKNNWTWKSIDYSVWNQNIAKLSLIFLEL